MEFEMNYKFSYGGLTNREEISIDRFNTPGYEKEMFIYYLIEHNCNNDIIRDDWRFCPFCGKSVVII